MAEFMDGFSGITTLQYGSGFRFHPFPWLNLWKIAVLENLFFRLHKFNVTDLYSQVIFAGYFCRV